jgi:glycosyltransferase involved in cell wall biosynthesis
VLLTAVTLCYNHERFVAEALESVRAQGRDDIQLVVVDDCSTDGSVRAVRDWIARTGFPCELVVHESNMGLVPSVNDAIRRARGELVAFVTADDRWLPGRVQRHAEAFARLPEDYAVVYGDAAIIDESGERTAASFIARHRGSAPAPDGDVFRDLLGGNFIPVPAATIRRSAYAAVGAYDESLAFEDYDMWLRLAARHRFAFVPGVVAEYRVLGDSLSRRLAGDPRLQAANALSNFRMVEKAARSRPLAPEEARIAGERLEQLARMVYRYDCRGALPVLWRSFRRRPTWRLGATLAASALGIGHSVLQRAKLLGRRADAGT